MTFLFKKAGFTVIELVVVVAILAVLATVVAINVISYLDKARDATIKGNMQTIASSATAFFEREGNFNNIFVAANNPTAINAMQSINDITSPNAVSAILKTDNSSWCVCSVLTKRGGSQGTSLNTYCVDSSGHRSESSPTCTSRCNTTFGICGN